MLPKISHPLFDVEIPSLQRTVKFRRFLVSEEKIVLLAAESSDEKDIVDACRQIINNCCQDEIDVESLASFDLEWCFIQLRRNSVNNIVNVAYKDNEDEQTYKFELDLKDIELNTTEGHTNRVELPGGIVMLMKYPTISVAESMLDSANQIEMVEKMIISCIDKIYDDETVYEDYSEEELREFLNSLDSDTYDRIKNFFSTMPQVGYTIEYTNTRGTERRIALSGLRDFFTCY